MNRIIPHFSEKRQQNLECQTTDTWFCAQDIALRYEAVRQNQVIYQSEDFDRGEMCSRVVREYLDFNPYLRIQREVYKRRWLDGQK